MELLASSGRDEIQVRSAYEPFFRAHFDRVARAAALIAGDPGSGQELAQEAFLRLYKRWDAMSSDEHARNFAFKVAVNLARSHVRKHLRLVPSGLAHADPSPSARPGPSGGWVDVAAALGTLSRRQRACVVLVDLVDMDAEGAARVLGINANTVRVHLMRGRHALRRSLGLKENEDEG